MYVVIERKQPDQLDEEWEIITDCKDQGTAEARAKLEARCRPERKYDVARILVTFSSVPTVVRTEVK